MRAEPGRRAARGPDRAQRGELRLAVEAVAGLSLPRRRAVPEHPGAVTRNPLAQAVLAESPRGADGGQDPAAGRVQLLVARSAGAERELLDAIAAQCRMGVAVDEAGHRAEPAPSSSSTLPSRRGRSRIRPTESIDPAVAEDVGVLQHLDRRRGRLRAGAAPRHGRGQLREIANEQPRHDG